MAGIEKSGVSTVVIRVIAGFAVFVLLLLLSGCSGENSAVTDKDAAPSGKGTERTPVPGEGEPVKPASPGVSPINFITIGTGGITGVYYPTGGAIAKIVNKKKSLYGIRCTVEATEGSVFNVNAVIKGDFELGVVQSDRQYQAFNGSKDSEWENNPQKSLKSVFAIHPESVTICASTSSGIRSLSDLKGKIVNIGNKGSGHRQNAIDILSDFGIDFATGMTALGKKPANAPGLLQSGRIDAFFYTVGHPSIAIREAISGPVQVTLVPVPNADRMVERFPYYNRALVPVKYYPNVVNKNDVVSIRVKATLVTSNAVPDASVYAVAREIFENLEEFKSLHPAYAGLTRKNMLEDLTAPFHPGALKYYQEAGLMDD